MKYFFLAFLIFIVAVGCKSNKNALVDDRPDMELTRDTQTLKASTNERSDNPVDIKQLIKALALTEFEEKRFMDIYGFYGREMSKIVSQKLDVKEENMRITGLSLDRDKEIVEFLNQDQKIIYKKYLSDVRKRKIMSEADSSTSKQD